MSKATVLFYAPAPVPYASQLLQLCAIQGLKLRTLGDGALESKLSDLAQGQAAPGEEPSGASLPEPILIFCGLNERQLDRLLSALRRNRVSVLKAMLAPTNSGWTLRALYEELCQERLRLS